jgi:hypothetical protein
MCRGSHVTCKGDSIRARWTCCISSDSATDGSSSREASASKGTRGAAPVQRAALYQGVDHHMACSATPYEDGVDDLSRCCGAGQYFRLSRLESDSRLSGL